MCPKMLKKSTKNQNTLTNLITSLSYIPQFDQLHFLNVSPWWWIDIDCTEGWLDYQKSREKYLIVWSSVQDWSGEDDWDIAFDRWNYPSTVGGCHWVDPTHLCQRLCQLHHHRQRPFWLMDCRNVGEATKMATSLYKEAIYVPFMAK